MISTFLCRAVFLLSAISGTVLASDNSTDFVERNLHTIQSIYNLTVYPNNVPIIQNGGSAVPPGLFNQDARGRVTPVGNFTGFEDSIEYFFSLAPTPQANPAGAAIFQADVVEFTSGCANVAASVVYLKTGPVNATTGQVIEGAKTTALKQAWSSIATGVDYTNVTIQQGAIATALCPGIQDRCTGANQQFNTTETCIAELSQKPFGTFDEAWGDNIACRTIHLILTGHRPEVHCPHVGPNGGNGPDNFKCVDIDYNEYLNDALLFGSSEVFRC
ncbi:hypothetical protein K435DRAFT_791698 [Dendrothele bispora CBS 962.96]|uniref:Uncharacterized protein n=1 Tax=Dendrothele bispora (strain CBS 962.96) TaxID=1314807 RepID=A0A4S8MLI2_DENBC|nr:hypothetical protein K435DRAFT_791698 [Dendrothele bispora CBS 962.96]